MKEIRLLLIVVLLLCGAIAGFREMGIAVAITIVIQALCLIYAIYLTYKKDK
jgi:uncharacterized membrane protein (DUF441 family)